jgi:hypothetical protein
LEKVFQLDYLTLNSLIMRKWFILLSFFLLFLAGGNNSYGQLYNTGVGARLGWFNGLTVKHFFRDGQAIEGILTTRWNGFILTGLYEYQRQFPDVNNLEWFVGGGAHVGAWDADRYGRNENTSSAFGLDLIIGVEYTFDEFPFSASLDWKPAFNLIGDNRLWGDGIALSIRYTFR